MPMTVVSPAAPWCVPVALLPAGPSARTVRQRVAGGGRLRAGARPLRAGVDPDDDDDDLGDDEPLTPEQPLPDEDSAFEDFDDEFDDDFEEDEHDPDWDHPDDAEPAPPPPPAKGPARKK